MLSNDLNSPQYILQVQMFANWKDLCYFCASILHNSNVAIVNGLVEMYSEY